MANLQVSLVRDAGAGELGSGGGGHDEGDESCYN